MYTFSEKKAHITELQRYLRELSAYYGDLPTVLPDGYFGERTAAAVEGFQQKFLLPVTGEADRATWDMIVSEALRLSAQNAPPIFIKAALPADFPMSGGDTGDGIFALQLMLRSLSQSFDGFPAPEISGVYDEPTAAAVMAAQLIFGLPPDGKADKPLWDALALWYNIRRK